MEEVDILTTFVPHRLPIKLKQLKLGPGDAVFFLGEPACRSSV
jgi:hypothetical protein